MSKTDTFYFQFRWPLLLSFFSGTYIPGINIILPKYFPTHFIFFTSLIRLSFNGIDLALKIALDSEDLEFIMYFTMIVSMLLYIWAFFTAVFLIICRKDMQDLISMWSSDFIPKLWPELREAALKHQKEKAWGKFSLLMKFYLVPYAITLGISVFKGELYVGTILEPGNSLKASRLVIVLQCLGGWSLMSWYTLLQCFISLILRLILVELEYLETALQKLFSSIRVRENGSIYTDEGLEKMRADLEAEDYGEICQSTEKKLLILFACHRKIFKFANQVEKIFGPIFLVQVVMLSTLLGMIAYTVSTGMLSADLATVLAGGLGFWSFLCFLNCSIGGEILEKSSGFVDTVFHANWWAYSVRIKKLLIPMIVVANHRPISVNPLGMLPMVPDTFATLTMFQYKFFRFLSDTVKG